MKNQKQIILQSGNFPKWKKKTKTCGYANECACELIWIKHNLMKSDKNN